MGWITQLQLQSALQNDFYKKKSKWEAAKSKWVCCSAPWIAFIGAWYNLGFLYKCKYVLGHTTVDIDDENICAQPFHAWFFFFFFFFY